MRGARILVIDDEAKMRETVMVEIPHGSDARMPAVLDLGLEAESDVFA